MSDGEESDIGEEEDGVGMEERSEDRSERSPLRSIHVEPMSVNRAAVTMVTHNHLTPVSRACFLFIIR